MRHSPCSLLIPRQGFPYKQEVQLYDDVSPVDALGVVFGEIGNEKRP